MPHVARLNTAERSPRSSASVQVFFGSLDAPQADETLRGFAHVHGWVLNSRRFRGEACTIELVVDGQTMECDVERLARQDVGIAFPHLAHQAPSAGFSAQLNVASLRNGARTLTVVAVCRDAREIIAEVGFFVANGPEHALYARGYGVQTAERRRRKLDFLAPLLQCPACAGMVTRTTSELSCVKCHTSYVLMDETPIMVSGVPEYPVDASLLQSPPSNNTLAPEVHELVERTIANGGVVLEVGSGRRMFGIEKLIQLEICAYPFTDIVNQGDVLPFRDESFDMVMSLAVTEHVRRPWVLAQEINRVTKRGGTVLVDSAFMQPLHGYPSHYFNMTRFALQEIFVGLDVVSLKAAPYQHPWFSINLMLNRLLSEVSPEVRTAIGGMTLNDFAAEAYAYCTGGPSRLAGLQLPDSLVDALAAGFTLVGRKP